MTRKVVVTGMGAVTPVGNDVKSMWSSLSAGKHGIGPITRFNTEGYKASLAAEVKDFDPLCYMERSEARRMDMYSQYAVASASQAVEDSGILGKVAPERFAVYFGSGTGGIVTFSEEHRKLQEAGPRRVSPLFIPMMISNIAAGNLAIRYGARGQCLCVVTACATGASAVGEAYRAIRHGYADAAIAGGSEAAITQISVAGFCNMTAMSPSRDPDAASLPFDRRRAGFVLGEGAGALILEEYGSAIARGAKIYAEVAGYGVTCDAHHMTAPDPEARSASRAITDAFDEAGRPECPIYINAHGTGTPLNDASETLAVKLALGAVAPNAAISSTKSMTGHMLGAAGSVEAIISILAMNDSLLPPTAGLREPDDACDLDYVPITARRADVGLAMSLSMGFGGHNVCLAFSKAAPYRPHGLR
ncbi:MAG: beta-ketoacyl-ACP synthase II [Oscillospiraceae bacterium]|jgi:3-oxoacyl-[acyl-carrier-protein] synthase II|nr:beta-ketoacyl-ACP synthase II [Oscillospiraceae bacterium]